MKIYTKESLIEELRKIRNMGWIPNARPGNAGGVGNTLEDLLGIEENNLPIPNAAEWELKCQRVKTTSLVTLFHMEPSPRALKFVPKILLPFYGWAHQEAGIKYDADEKKAIKAAACSKFMNVVNGAGVCLFGTFLGAKRIPVFDWLNAATGWNKAPEEYMEMGGHIQTLKQLFNIKHGIDPKSAKVSDRVLGRPPQKEGANRDRTADIEKMMAGYWSQFGWNPETGRPDPECLKSNGFPPGSCHPRANGDPASI